MKRYNFHELRALAKSQGTPKQGYMNKDQLCKALGIVRRGGFRVRQTRQATKV